MKSGVYIAAYDVSDDRERDILAGVLESVGVRLQKSVFECRLSRSGRETLLKRLKELELETGFVALYRIDDAARRFAVGKISDAPLADDRHAWVI